MWLCGQAKQDRSDHLFGLLASFPGGLFQGPHRAGVVEEPVGDVLGVESAGDRSCGFHGSQCTIRRVEPAGGVHFSRYFGVRGKTWNFWTRLDVFSM